MLADFCKNMITIAYSDNERNKYHAVERELISQGYQQGMSWIQGDRNLTSMCSECTIEEMKEDYRQAKNKLTVA